MEITCQHICAALQLICARPRRDRGALLGNLNRHVTWSSLSVAFWLSSCPLISHSYVTFLNYLTSNHHNSNWTLCSEVKSYNIGKKHPLTFELITWFVAVTFPECLRFHSNVSSTYLGATEHSQGSFLMDSLFLRSQHASASWDGQGKKKKRQTSGSVFCNGVNPLWALGQPPTHLKRIGLHSHIHKQTDSTTRQLEGLCLKTYQKVLCILKHTQPWRNLWKKRPLV